MSERRKPLLFLDVDGVLNAVPPIEGQPVTKKLGFPICIPEGTRERVARLTAAFEPVWATTWRERADTEWRDELGLTGDPWDHIEFASLKLPSILDHAVEIHMSDTIVTPWVWIDDDAPWEMRRMGIQHDERTTLILAPDTGKGLEDQHVNRALVFAEEVQRRWDAGER